MKKNVLSFAIISSLGILLSCQQNDVSVLDQKQQLKKDSAGARYANGSTFDITAQNPLFTSGNCRQFYAPKSQGYKTLVTVNVNSSGSTTFVVQGSPASPGSNCSSFQAVSRSGGITTSTSNGWLWTVPGSGSYQLTFYVTMGNSSSGACQATWSVSPNGVQPNDCSVGTGETIVIVKDLS